MSKPKTNTGTDLATRQEAPTPVVGSAQLPDYLRNMRGPTGAENISSEDITVPRLKIGQDMNPEVQEGSVERGDLFLNVSGEVVNPAGQKLPFVVLAQAKEYILWRPKKDGGGILDRARPVATPDGVRYKWGKPNSSYDVKVEGVQRVTWKTGVYADEKTVAGGKDDAGNNVMLALIEWGSEIPGDKESKKAATEHHNYVVSLPTYGDLVAALSLSRTANGPAKDFNALLKMGTVPLVGRIYTVNTWDDKRDAHAFKNYKFRPAGFVTEQADFDRYDAMSKSFKGKTINVDQSDGDQEAATDDRA